MKKAEMGIGTLIIFIAMILVAAIAAGVLLSTAMGLQTKALVTGERTKNKVATQIEPTLIYGEEGTLNNSLEYFYAELQLAPGSSPIKYDQTLIVLSTSNTSVEYSYNSSINCSNVSTMKVGQYGVDELLSTDNSRMYFSRGEVVEVCLDSENRPIGEDEDFSIQFLPKLGNPVIMNLLTPTVITQERVILYP